MEHPELGTPEFARLMTKEVSKWTESMEKKYTGEVWRYFSMIGASYSPQGETHTVGLFVLGRDINIASTTFKWMDEMAHTRVEMGIVDNASEELKRLGTLLEQAAASPYWIFDTRPMEENGVQLYLGKSNIPTK